MYYLNFVTCTEFIYPDGQISPGPDLPTPVILHCMVTLPSDKVMILGGYTVPAAENPKKVIVFDLKMKNYTVLPSMNYNRMNAGCAIFQSAYHENRTVVLAVGGWKVATAEIYDFTKPNSSWTESKFSLIFLVVPNLL